MLVYSWTWYSSRSLAVSNVASILLSQSRKFFSNSTSKSMARTPGFYWTGRLSAHFCPFHLSARGLSTGSLSVSTRKALCNCQTEIHGKRSALFKKEKAKMTAKRAPGLSEPGRAAITLPRVCCPYAPERLPEAGVWKINTRSAGGQTRGQTWSPLGNHAAQRRSWAAELCRTSVALGIY